MMFIAVNKRNLHSKKKSDIELVNVILAYKKKIIVTKHSSHKSFKLQNVSFKKLYLYFQPQFF